MANEFRVDVPVGMGPRQAAHELIYRLSGVLQTTHLASHEDGRLTVRTNNGHAVKWGERCRVVEISVSPAEQADEIERVRLEIAKFNERYVPDIRLRVSMTATPSRSMTDVLAEIWLALTAGKSPTWQWIRGDETNGALFQLCKGVFYVYEDSRTHYLAATREGLELVTRGEIQKAVCVFNQRRADAATEIATKVKSEEPRQAASVLSTPVQGPTRAKDLFSPGAWARASMVEADGFLKVIAREKAEAAVASLPATQGEILLAQKKAVEQAHIEEVRSLIRACLPEFHEGQAVLELMALTVRAEVINGVCVITFPDDVWMLARKLQRVYPLPAIETGCFVLGLPASPAVKKAREVVRMRNQARLRRPE
jgi:hypothetical protein